MSVKDLAVYIKEHAPISIEELLESSPCKVFYYKQLLLVGVAVGESTTEIAHLIGENRLTFPNLELETIVTTADLTTVLRILLRAYYKEWTVFTINANSFTEIVLLTKQRFLSYSHYLSRTQLS